MKSHKIDITSDSILLLEPTSSWALLLSERKSLIGETYRDTLNSEPTSVLELSAESHPEFVSRVVVVCE